MGNMRTIDVVILAIFFLVMAGIGPYFARRKKSRNTETYFVGNRQFPGWLIGLSMFATSISSVTVVAYPADGYKTAYLRFLIPLALPLGILICSAIFLPFYRRAKVTSAFEYLEGRFGPGVRLYAAIAFIVNQFTRLALILYLVSVLVHEMTGFSPVTCVLLSGTVTAFYTVTGGIEAVVWSGFIKSFLLWAGCIAIFVTLISKIDGGLSTVFSVASADGKFMLGDLNTATGQLEPAPWGFSLTQKTVSMLFLVGLVNFLFEYSSNQNVIQKYVAAKNPKEATRAIWVCCACSIPTWFFFMFLGTCFYVFFKLNPTPEAAAMLDGTQKAEGILPHFAIRYLPAGLSGLVVAAILAAAMTALASSINAISAVGVTDIYKRHIVREGSERHYYFAALGFSILGSLAMFIGAFLLMQSQGKTMQDTATKMNSLAIAGLLGIFMLGFLTKRGDSRSVAVGIAAVFVYSMWILFIELKFITLDGVTALGFSEPWARFISSPMDTYYAGIVGNLLLFVVGYFVGTFIFPTKRDLKNLTVWDQDWRDPEVADDAPQAS